MIVDRLENLNFYKGLPANVVKGLAFLRDTDLASLEPGKVVIDGDDLFAMVMDYETRPVSELKYEAHRKYRDIHYVVTGLEHVGYVDMADAREVTYEESIDFALLEGEGTLLPLKPGMFIFFDTHEGHAPSLHMDEPSSHRKIVVKIRV